MITITTIVIHTITTIATTKVMIINTIMARAVQVYILQA
jgi:hypothetical protein